MTSKRSAGSFPLFKTKNPEITTKFDLGTPAGRKEYFEAKAGKQIEDIKEYLDKSTFLGILLAKKSAGKGTYSKMFQEIVGDNRVELISIGDLVREVHEKVLDSEKEKAKVLEYLKANYRGFMSLEEAFDAFVNKSQEKLIPTEFILALVKKKIDDLPEKAIFLDGFPRDLDQISYSLYFRQIMNLREDPDFYVLIDVPESIIEARMASRVICPSCHTSRNTALLPTQFVSYDKQSESFYMLCDNVSCDGYKKSRMVRKEGDEQGLAPLRSRLDKDGKLIEKAILLHGIPKVFLRNAIPVTEKDGFDDYEITPEYSFSYDKASDKVIIKESSWVIKDDHGENSHSLLAAPVVLAMIYQIHELLFGKGKLKG